MASPSLAVFLSLLSVSVPFLSLCSPPPPPPHPPLCLSSRSQQSRSALAGRFASVFAPKHLLKYWLRGKIKISQTKHPRTLPNLAHPGPLATNVRLLTIWPFVQWVWASPLWAHWPLRCWFSWQRQGRPSAPARRPGLSRYPKCCEAQSSCH